MVKLAVEIEARMGDLCNDGLKKPADERLYYDKMPPMSLPISFLREQGGLVTEQPEHFLEEVTAAHENSLKNK